MVALQAGYGGQGGLNLVGTAVVGWLADRVVTVPVMFDPDLVTA